MKFYKCYNYHWGKSTLVNVEIDTNIPVVKGTPEEALTKYKNALSNTDLGKEHPEWINDSIVSSNPIEFDCFVVDWQIIPLNLFIDNN